MNSLYETYEEDTDVRASRVERHSTHKTIARPTSRRRNSYSRGHNRPQVFNGIHRRRHKKFTW